MTKQLVSAKEYLDASNISFKAPKRVLISYAYSASRSLIDENKFILEKEWNRGELYVTEDKSLGILLKIGLGGPILAMCLHELTELGMEECIILGVAGGIRSKSETGDVLQIQSAITCDGVSIHYGVSQEKNYVPKNPLLVDFGNYNSGTCVSMSAPYQENNLFFKKFSTQATCIDMETSVLFAVGDFLGLRTASFLVVNDILSENGWSFSKNATKTKEAFTKLLRISIEKSTER